MVRNNGQTVGNMMENGKIANITILVSSLGLMVESTKEFTVMV